MFRFLYKINEICSDYFLFIPDLKLRKSIRAFQIVDSDKLIYLLIFYFAEELFFEPNLILAFFWNKT